MSFHELLHNLRITKGVTLRELSIGLCSESMLSRIESGEKETKKMMRDRLLGRLGVAPDGFEEYLKPSEYTLWECQQQVLDAIESENNNRIKDSLQAYEGMIDARDPVAMQFFYMMCAEAETRNGGEDAVRQDYLKKALHTTLPMQRFDDLMEIGIAEQEYNVLLEYLDSFQEERISQYNRYASELIYQVICHMEERELDTLSLSKVFTKAVWLYGKKIRSGGGNYSGHPYMLELCEKAVGILRDSLRSYYLFELLDLYEQLLDERLHNNRLNNPEADVLKEKYRQCVAWRETIREIYADFQINEYMKDNTYIYRENEIHKTSDIIRRRRVMLGFSRETLARMAKCSVKAIIAAESGKSDTQNVLLRDVFISLGLPSEYTKHEIITDDVEALSILFRSKRENIKADYEKEENSLRILERSIDTNNISNSQYLKYRYAGNHYAQGKISLKEYYREAIDAINITVPTNEIKKKKKMNNPCFFTKAETQCLHAVLILKNRGEVVDEEIMEMILSFCGDCVNKTTETSRGFYYLSELLFTTIASIKGNEGLKKESDRISKTVIKTSLRNRRLYVIAANLHGIIWNQRQSSKLSPQRNETHARVLQQCVCLSNFCKRNNREQFYKEELQSFQSGT